MNKSGIKPLQIDIGRYAEACAYLDVALKTLENAIGEARHDITDSQIALGLEDDAGYDLFLLSRAAEKIVAGGKVALLDVTDAVAAMIRSVEHPWIP